MGNRITSAPRHAAPPLRVLVISHTAISRAAGQARFLPLLRHKDITCRIVVPHRWKNYGAWAPVEKPLDPLLDVRVGRVMLPWFGPCQWYLHWYPGLARSLREFRPDVIDLWEEPWGLVSVQAAWLRNRLLPSAKLIVETEQNIDKHLPFPFEGFRTFVLNNADLVIGRSKEATAVVRGKGYTGPTVVVPNGVDVEVFKQIDRVKARRMLGLSGFVAGYVGRLVEEKGTEDLVDALRFLPAHVNVAFVGSGPLRTALGEKARAADVLDRVHFFPSQPPVALAEMMNAFDVLALPSRTTRRWKEQFGRVIIEAHACRLPVIGSRSGAIPDVVGAGGITVAERDPKALAAAIARLEQDPAMRAEMAREGHAQVESEYAWERVAETLLSQYRSVRRGANGNSSRLRDFSAYSAERPAADGSDSVQTGSANG
jgi:glycosyltransferase involved in cell wall biosynthesis